MHTLYYKRFFKRIIIKTSACGDTSVVISVVFLGEGERDKLNCFSFIKFKIYFIALILYYYITEHEFIIKKNILQLRFIKRETSF